VLSKYKATMRLVDFLMYTAPADERTIERVQ